MINESDSSPRWQAYTHEEILAMVRAGPGPAASEDAAGRWEATWSTVAMIEDNLSRAIAEAGSGWAGAAAAAMTEGTTPLGQWAGQAAAQAEATAKTVEAQGRYAEFTRREMPPLAHPDIPTGTFRGPGPYMSGVPIMTDWAAVEHDRDAATARARDLMETYGRNSYDTLPGMLESQAPPTVVIQNTATGTVHGVGIVPAGTLPGGDPVQPGSTAGGTLSGGAAGVPGLLPAARAPAGATVRAGPGNAVAGTSGPVTAAAGTRSGEPRSSGGMPGPARAGTTGSPGPDGAGGGPLTQGRAADPGLGPPGRSVTGETGGTGYPGRGPSPPTDPLSGGLAPRSPTGAGPSADGTGYRIPGGTGMSGDPGGGSLPRGPAGPGLADPATGSGFGGRLAANPLPPTAVLDRGSPERPFPSSEPAAGRATGQGLMPMAAAGMGRSGGEEHRRPSYLVDDGSAFADDRPIPGSVINEGWPRA